MKVSNFKIAPAMFAPGDEVDVSFTVKAETSDTIGEYGLIVWALIPGYGEIIAYRDESFKISKGSTKTVNAKTVFGFGNRTFSRGDTISEFGVQLGYSGSRVDLNFPIVMLDARYKPSILMFAGERCDVNGFLNDEGLAMLTNIALSKSEQADTSVMSLLAYFKNESAPSEETVVLDLTNLMSSALASEIQTIISEVVLKTNADYSVTLWFGDQYESASTAILVSRAFANMHLSGLPTGGVCFGGFSLSTANQPLMESHYEGVFYNGIRGVTNYLSEEIETGGRWIDGKPIYRAIGELAWDVSTANQTLPTPSGIYVTRFEAYARNTSSDTLYPLPTTHPSNTTYSIRVSWTSDSGFLFSRGSVWNASQYSVYKYVVIYEYTKNTD